MTFPELTYSELAAWYAASLSTFVLLFELYKWFKSGPKLRVTVTPNVKGMGGYYDPAGLHTQFDIVNIGDQLTTITSITLYQYKNIVQRMLSRSVSKYVIELNRSASGYLSDAVPYDLKVGETWRSFSYQAKHMQELSKNDIYIYEIQDSWRKKPYRRKVKF
ncbi:hypothetical protein [Paremcibacter congregatus]|uniref:Uncharacterized protein n=1 Tax=Paremcibacter congregatus TaxID=2043170 RepID=A0A2G4YMD8_9PROT|nr:hypothetical protein [Paremcibacter congregatus]PHZ83481.1 hypothetical protein CRD36_18165 [Paremcibacter congregatus]QDE28052.1 hypothetical protein FIV45_12640 [Paremcibacter congregatus]